MQGCRSVLIEKNCIVVIGGTPSFQGSSRCNADNAAVWGPARSRNWGASGGYSGLFHFGGKRFRAAQAGAICFVKSIRALPDGSPVIGDRHFGGCVVHLLDPFFGDRTGPAQGAGNSGRDSSKAIRVAPHIHSGDHGVLRVPLGQVEDTDAFGDHFAGGSKGIRSALAAIKRLHGYPQFLEVLAALGDFQCPFDLGADFRMSLLALDVPPRIALENVGDYAVYRGPWLSSGGYGDAHHGGPLETAAVRGLIKLAHFEDVGNGMFDVAGIYQRNCVTGA